MEAYIAVYSLITILILTISLFNPMDGVDLKIRSKNPSLRSDFRRGSFQLQLNFQIFNQVKKRRHEQFTGVAAVLIAHHI